MHAVIVEVQLDPDSEEEGQRMLLEEVVPMVKASPGFVSGVWARSDDKASGIGFVVFESEDAARQAAKMASEGARPGAPPSTQVQVCEVTAQA